MVLPQQFPIFRHGCVGLWSECQFPINKPLAPGLHFHFKIPVWIQIQVFKTQIPQLLTQENWNSIRSVNVDYTLVSGLPTNVQK